MVPTPDSSTRTWFIHIYPPFYRPMVAWPLGSSFLEFSKGSSETGIATFGTASALPATRIPKNPQQPWLAWICLPLDPIGLLDQEGRLHRSQGARKLWFHRGIWGSWTHDDSWAHGPSTGSFYITPYKVWLPQLPLGMLLSGTAAESRYFPIIIQ